MNKQMIYTFHGSNFHRDEVELDDFLESFNTHAPEYFENIRAFSSKSVRNKFADKVVKDDEDVTNRLNAMLDRGI